MSRVDTRFAQYVTRVAFNLTLSSDQITAMAVIKTEQLMDAKRLRAKKPKRFLDIGNPTGPRFSHFVPAFRGLERRGLAVWEDPIAQTPKWNRYPYNLTESGEAVYRLLELAGLVRDVSDWTREKAA